LNQINIVVRDMEATMAFYRRLGVTIDGGADDPHVAVRFPGVLRNSTPSTSTPTAIRSGS